MRGLGCALVLATSLICLCAGPVVADTPYVMLGQADILAIDQPRVAVEVYIPEPEHSFGPVYANTFLLDTGAQGLMAVGYSVDEMTGAGYETVAVFDELGIGGSTPYDVSEVYNLDFAGSDGTRYTLDDIRLLSNSSVDFGSFGGIVGMSAMLGRTTTLDMTAMLGGEYGFDYMGVGFSAAPPADNGHRYGVPLSIVDFPPSGQRNPEDPLPTYAPLPFIDVEMRHGAGSAGGSFVLDTGASISMLSSAFAFELGLDSNENGSLDDEAVGFLDLTGAGGTVNVPLLAVEKLVLAADEGIELIWRDLTLPVYDIDPSIAGIFGCELLTSGWFEGVFATGEFGYIEQVHLDFRDPGSMTGAMLLDLNPDYDNVTDPPLTPGDANGDGIVDDLDLTALATHWQQAGGWADGDFNDDGFVDDIDLTVLAMAWPAGDLNVSAVPEPTTLSLLVLLALSLPKRLGLASTCVTRTRRNPTGAKSR